MNIGSFFAAVVMVVTGFLGGLFHQAPPPMMQNGGTSTTSQTQQPTPQTGQASSTSQTQQLQKLLKEINAGGLGIRSTSSPQTSSLVSTTLPNGEAWGTTLPLGDSKYTTSGPEAGYIYLCHVQSGGQGAQGTPTWISGNAWYPNEKVNVEGSVAWPNATYSMTISGSERIIKSNGLPTDHDTGTFPIARTDPAHQFDANPNSIEAQNYDYQLPVDPTMLATPDCIYGEVGMMDDGVPLFDGFDAEYRDALAHETLDQWNGHPDQTGVYHNHGFEQGPVKEPVSTVVGFAFDGYPITGSLLPDGNYLHTADLDECHGITSTITLDGKSVTMYHYVLTQDFPYTVGCFRGTSYEPKPNGGSNSPSSMGGMEMGSQTNVGQGQGSPPTPPQAALTACASAALGNSCSFTDGPRTIPGTCLNAPNESQLVCIPTN